jgi:hypothetical protein
VELRIVGALEVLEEGAQLRLPGLKERVVTDWLLDNGGRGTRS